MPVLSHEYLTKVCHHIFRALGASQEEAGIVSTHVVKANLVGHDSHGVIQVPVYTERIKMGHIVPGASFEVLDETPATARINGNWGFGYVVTERAMKMAIEKAKANGVAALTVFYQSHIGRLGDYPTMAAREGMIGLITADSGKGPKAVAPFGGSARRLGTNPICIGVPSDLEGTVLLDMATSAVAAGKVSLAISRQESIPSTWVIDKDGNPTTNPQDYFDGGAILPVGADQGHKGYGLSFMVEMFSGILTGLGFGIDPLARHNDGCFIAVFNVAAFRPLAEFKREVREFAEFVKTSPPAKGFKEVLYPGEIEWRTEQQRRRDGIFVEDETWQQLWVLVQEHKLEDVVGRP
jgi:uncharacterized oxidoreductase